MSARRIGFGLVLLVSLGASRTAAQSLQRFSLQGSGAVLFATRNDPNFESKTRLGFGQHALYTFSRFSLGAVYQRSKVSSSPQLILATSLGWVEPRLVVAANNTLA